MLATVYHAGDPIDITAFRVSEKFDGVRAWWDGHRLLTRSGTPIAVPVWFTENWPNEVLDGELWGGRGEFEVVSGVVRKSEPVDTDWRQVR
jgi:DNA ligase-1